MNNNSNNRTKTKPPPPDLRRLLVAGMLDATRRVVRSGRWLSDADPDDLLRLRDDLTRIAEVLAYADRCHDSADADRAEAQMILDDLFDRVRLGGPDLWEGEPPPPPRRSLAVTVIIDEMPIGPGPADGAGGAAAGN
jgi:hypothetical protein